MADQHANLVFAQVTVAPSPATSGTTIGISNAQAALFPNPASGAYNPTVWPANQTPISTNSEVLRFTAKGAADSAGSGNTQFTIARLQEQNAASTMTARSIQVGDWIALNVTKKWFTDIETSIVPVTGGTFSGDVLVPDEVYGSGWNGSLEVPTKNALYDKIETLGSGGGNGLTVAGYEQPDLPYSPDGWGIKSIDFQVVGKFDTWDFLSDAQINLMLDEAKAAGAKYIGIAIPYDRVDKWARWIPLIRARKLSLNARSAWNAWQGINRVRSGVSITRSGTTATVTCGQPHNLATGSVVTISGAVETAYNGNYSVTVTSTTVFTYTVAGSPATPATGYIEVTPVTSITRSGTTATLTSAIDHGLTTGQKILVSGTTQTEYNGEFLVTVTNSKVLTYTVSGSPSTPATGTINWYYPWETYRDKTAEFIEDHPTYWEPGDMVTMCVEPNNAESTGSYNYTFKDTKKVSGSFSYALFNQSLLDQVFYANAAFTAIGLNRQIHTWAISPSIDNLDLNGVSWYSTGGNASGLGYLDFLKYFGGYVAVDHYQSADILDAGTYAERMAYDLDAFTRSFPGCKYFQGEIGYHTEDVVSDQNQQDVLWAVTQALLAAKHVCGVNYWVNVGSTTTSLWADTSGTLTAGGRLAVRGAITQAFKNGAISSAVYGEGVLGGNRTKIDFTGSSNAFVSAVDNPALNKVDVSVIPVLSKTTLYNYIANPSFEISLTGWTNYGTYDTIERSTAQFNNGTASIRINNATAKDGGVSSSAITLTAGTYYLSAYRKLSAAVDNAHLIIRTVGGSTHGACHCSPYTDPRASANMRQAPSAK